MTRFTLALVAILLLTLSAGFSQTQLRQTPLDQQAIAGQALARRQQAVADDVLSLAGQQEQLRAANLALSRDEDAPPPALLAYLGLVLIGGAVSVGMIRRSQRRQI